MDTHSRRGQSLTELSLVLLVLASFMTFQIRIFKIAKKRNQETRWETQRTKSENQKFIPSH